MSSDPRSSIGAPESGTDEPWRHNLAIEARASADLRRSSYPAVRRVQCKYESGTLKLTGRMPNYFTRQVALRIVLQCLKGEIAVEDRLEVVGS